MKNLPGQFIDTKANVSQRYTAILFQEDGEVVTIPVITAASWNKEWLTGIWPLKTFQDRFAKVA